MMYRISTCLAVIVLISIQAFAQEASVSWPLDGEELPGISGSVEAEPQQYSDKMALYSFEEFPTSEGQQATASTIQTVSQKWTKADSPVDSLYIQYAVSAKEGGTFYVDSLSMFLGAWYTQNIRAEIYYSKLSDFSDKDTLIKDRSLIGDELELLTAAFQDSVKEDEKLYIRIYPYNTESEGWAKLVAIHNVQVFGTATGVSANVPEVATYNPEGISTTFASAGGNISSDGGAAVTERGLVWSTSESPTIEDRKRSAGSGTGSFSATMIDLEPATTYFYRAYATNEAGTAYGREVSFTTLTERTVPEVTTNDITNIRVKTAETGGRITEWGGSEVTARGIVWNTTGEPTIDDDLIVAGSGTGNFLATLNPLEEDTRYYVRAFATNEVGTGYGRMKIFKTQTAAPNITKVVAQDGSGDFTTVQDAFDDVPSNYTGIYTIHVKKGEYYEKLILEEDKINVKLVGEHRDSTVLWYDDYAGIAGGTSQSYSVAINADDFVAENITFQNVVKNDKSVSDQQAVALVTNGDRQAYYNVNILGYQDTFYARGSNKTGRIYIKNSYIEGSVDFIFGRNIVVFDSTQIHINRNGGTLTAAATESESKFGFVFIDNVISADSIGFDGDPIESFHLGRPWQQYPRTVFINTYYPEALNPRGWLTWNVQPALYGEYNCSGPGCVAFENRIDIATELTEQEAAEYTIENIFSKESNPNFGLDWMPSPELYAVSNSEELPTTPETYKIKQNYPNPFNPTTNITYSLPKSGLVNISVFDMLGKKVATLTNEIQTAGNHTVTFDASSLSSGVYLYRIEADNFIGTNKMTLIK